MAPTTAANSFGGLVIPVNVLNLQIALSNHPNREFVNKLCLELREGARIGYSGPRRFRSRGVVTSHLEEEVAKGILRATFLPRLLRSSKFHLLALFLKKHSDIFRTIFHLFFSKSGNSSIDHFIDKDDFSLQYITTNDAISTIQGFGSDCSMATTDIESAFRLFPVHPDVWKLLGMFCNGFYYFDKVLLFGLSSAPFIFNQLSDAIES